MARVFLSWLAAVIICVVVGAAALAYFDQQGFLAAAGGAETLSLADRLVWYGNTLYGLVVINGTGLGFGIYPVLVAIALAAGLGVAAIFVRFAPALRLWWYAGAGAVAMIVMLVALHKAQGMMVVPGARTMAGLAAQGAAGFLAGAVFAMVSAKRR